MSSQIHPLDTCTLSIDHSRVAVVGNAAFTHEDGHWIDSFDHVIRFNSQLPTDETSPFIGTKTTIMLGALQGFRIAKKRGDLHKMTEKYVCIARQPTDMVPWHFPNSFNKNLQHEYGAEPTTGAMCLYWLTQWHRPLEISCFGFDFLKTRPAYRDGAIHTARHKHEAEYQMAIDFQRLGVRYPRIYVPHV